MRHLLTSLLACLAFAAQAQTLTTVKIDPPEPKAGEKATLTADFDISSGALLCNVRVNFGDGSAEENFKINQTKDVPLVVSHTFAKPGNYTVKVEPRTKMPVVKCTGDDKSVAIKVVAPPKAVAAKAADQPAAAMAACPEGWKLDKKSHNKKTGAFMCGAKPGTPLPAAKLSCPGNLGYYENAKRAQIGCRP